MRGRQRKAQTREAAPFVCVSCGDQEDAAAWLNRKDLARSQQCQTCFQWTGRLKDKDDPNMVRICGVLFFIGPEDDPSIRGHAGRKFIVRFNDGRDVWTKNLWYVGPIPFRFRSILSDNARWGENP